MHPASLLPAVIDGLRDLATALHLAFEQAYAEANTLYARAAACWQDGDHDGYTRLMQEHARRLAQVDDLDALYWAANRAACDLAAHLEADDETARLYVYGCYAVAARKEGKRIKQEKIGAKTP